ncbi:NAD(P)-binding protein [Calocera viscosa TUFC12733]|uniref:NAD(P)-binding protein n=1 Tax=Calocera viscosa (strain TUFC12733) TaxID=1330018 RepID=A0A167MTA9_CALVF|nr:NAD(P)-binding protein [Calocera viscosa TUFC12733]
MTRFAWHPKFGIYQKYCVVIVDGTIAIPESFSFDQAATLPLAYLTAALGLYTSMQLPLPLDAAGKVTPSITGETLLVWGGSSSVGALAVQLGVISGFRVISTASPRNFEYVKSLGAEKVLDYRDADIVDQIKALAPGLRYAYDAISENGSIEATFSALDHPAAEVVLVLPFSGAVPGSTRTHYNLAGGIYGPGHEAALSSLIPLWDALMRQGKVIPNPVKVMPNGLNSIDEGFDLMRQGKVSGVKLVYHPQETRI